MAFTKKSSMDFQRPFVEVSLGPSVTVRAGAEPRGDVVFLPSDSMGSPGALNSAMLKKLGLPLDLPPPAELSKGHAFQPFSGGTICYIVTVGRLPADRALQAYLLDALGSSELQGAGEIWLPLMGTGSGGLSHDQSFTIILETLRSSGWLNRSGRHATISTPDKIPDDASTALRAAIFTAKAALEDGALPDDGASPDVYQLAKTPAVEGALTLAAEFARHPHSARRLSSTSLFFALAESQSAMAPPSLAQDGASDLFALAVQELAGRRYAAAWEQHFGAAPHPSGPPTDGKLPRPTSNVAAILQHAWATARSMGARAIGIDHLIHALLSKSEVQLREVLEQMDVAPDRLLKEYADARLGQITTKFRNDVATDVDRLGYDNYARAIAEFLTHAETPPPLSISIQAPWGGGKSSLMNLVREKLDPRSVREKYKPKIGDPQQQLRLRLGKVLKMLDRAEPFTIQSG